jgi:uncharacterized membrane protein YedE/YeeE
MKPISLLAILSSSTLFGFGLAHAAMIRPENALSLLRFQDFGLMLVLGGAAGVTALSYQRAPRLLRQPWFEAGSARHAANLDRQTLGGGTLFGIG